MIALTRFDGTQFYVNADFIIFVEMHPDTVVSLIDHNKLRVRETAEEVVELIIAYRRQIAGPINRAALVHPLGGMTTGQPTTLRRLGQPDADEDETTRWPGAT